MAGRPSRRLEEPLYSYIEMFGTRDIAGFLAVPAAIDYMKSHDWAQVRARCFAMALDTKRTIEQFFGVAPICPESFEWFSQLVPFACPTTLTWPSLARSCVTTTRSKCR